MFRSPKFRRSMSDAEFYGITIISALLAGAPIAVLSMFIASPFTGWPS